MTSSWWYKWVDTLAIIGSDNGLSPLQHQTITYTNNGPLLIWPLGTNFSGILIKIQQNSFNKINFIMSSAKLQSFCLSLNVFKHYVFKFMAIVIAYIEFFPWLLEMLRHAIISAQIYVRYCYGIWDVLTETGCPNLIEITSSHRLCNYIIQIIYVSCLIN